MVATHQQNASYYINEGTTHLQTNRQKKPGENFKETSRSDGTETGQQVAQLHVS
jgi:hypothetical protein